MGVRFGGLGISALNTEPPGPMPRSSELRKPEPKLPDATTRTKKGPTRKLSSGRVAFNAILDAVETQDPGALPHLL